MSLEAIERVLDQAGGSCPVRLMKLGEMANELRHVTLSFPQRRKRDRDHVEAKEDRLENDPSFTARVSRGWWPR